MEREITRLLRSDTWFRSHTRHKSGQAYEKGHQF